MDSSSKKINPVLVFLLLFSIGLVVVIYFIRTNKTAYNQTVEESVTTNISSTKKRVLPTSTPTPTPRKIPHGKSGFIISLGSAVKGPRMGKLDLDPYDPEKNTKQKITVEVADQVNPVQKVSAILKTDNKTSQELTLTLISGTNKSGNWSGEWIVDDSYLYTYHLTIKALSSSGESSVGITLR